MSTQAQIIDNLKRIAATAESTTFGTAEQAVQIREAAEWYLRLLGLVGLPVNWLDRIADNCQQNEYFGTQDRANLNRAIQCLEGLQEIVG